MNKLSKREKVLLYILILFALMAASIYFLVLPALQKYSELSTSVDELAATEMEIRTAIQSGQSHKENLQILEQQLISYTEKMYPGMSNDGFDNMLTKMLLDNRVNPDEMEIASVQFGPVSPYGGVPVAEGQTAEEAAMALPASYYNTANVVAYGTLTSVIEYADILSRMDTLKMQSFHIYIDEARDLEGHAEGFLKARETGYKIEFSFIAYMKDEGR